MGGSAHRSSHALSSSPRRLSATIHARRRIALAELLEELLRTPNRLDKRVDVFARAVQVERGARRRTDPKRSVQRLRAVVTGADGDAVLVYKSGEVVCVHACDVEEVVWGGRRGGR